MPRCKDPKLRKDIAYKSESIRILVEMLSESTDLAAAAEALRWLVQDGRLTGYSIRHFVAQLMPRWSTRQNSREQWHTKFGVYS